MSRKLFGSLSRWHANAIAKFLNNANPETWSLEEMRAERKMVAKTAADILIETIMDSGGERSKRNVPGHTSDVFTRQVALPSEIGLRRAADILNAGQKVAILAGGGALGAGFGGVWCSWRL